MAALNAEIAQQSKDGSDVAIVRFSPWSADQLVLTRFAAVGDPVRVVFQAEVAHEIDNERPRIQAIFVDAEERSWLTAVLSPRDPRVDGRPAARKLTIPADARKALRRAIELLNEAGELSIGDLCQQLGVSPRSGYARVLRRELESIGATVVGGRAVEVERRLIRLPGLVGHELAPHVNPRP